MIRIDSHSKAPVDLDPTLVKKSFNRDSFLIQHHLSGHPSFQLERLVELSRTLPESRVEFNLGELPISIDPAATPRNGLSIEQTIKQIETCRSWLVLKQVQNDDEYRAHLDACLDEVNRYTAATSGPMFDRIGFVFISSPGAVTPFHIDPECNFLLQIHGSKRVYVFDKDDRELVSDSELEAFYSGGHRNLALDESLKQRASCFEIKPGQGLHIPQHAPDYVENGDQVSVSFSITFNVTESDRDRSVYWFNKRLRKLRFDPLPPGKSAFWDSAKYATFRTIRGMKRAFLGKGKRV